MNPSDDKLKCCSCGSILDLETRLHPHTDGMCLDCWDEVRAINADLMAQADRELGQENSAKK